MSTSVKFGVVIAALQVLFFILYGTCTEYHHDLAGENATNTNTDIDTFYPQFQDVHVMIFVGFAFLVTFLKKYTASAASFNFIVAALAVQWGALTVGFWHQMPLPGMAGAVTPALHKIQLSVESLITADFAAGSVLISFGALFGKMSPLQLVVMMFCHLIVYGLNEWLGLAVYGAADAGGTMLVHCYGAYFGVACSAAFCNKKPRAWKETRLQGATRQTDTMALVGTLFLWVFWPSFNSALLSGAAQQRAVINTFFALAGSCVAVFAASNILREGHKLNMVDIQNGTLAGGVAVGAVADLDILPVGALVVGSLGGLVCTIGYVYISPLLESKLNIHDTAGVHNLHGLPSIVGGLAGVVVASFQDASSYGGRIEDVYGARENGNRSAGSQALYQLATLGTSLGLALLTGYCTGLLARLNAFDPLSEAFLDEELIDIEGDDQATQANQARNHQFSLTMFK
eukprot:m.355441 g.355441  ORF g.355441 m.355441 type:complete len:458 (+) comp17253_c0_seq1:291-1664(+)